MGLWIPSGLKDDGGTPAPTPVDIVTFGGGTDEQIGAMLNAYYNDELSWSEMNWSVGDERIIHLDAMTAPAPNASTTINAQDITIVITTHDHSDLQVPINGHTKACITVQTKELLYASGAYANGTTTTTSFTKWSMLALHYYLNNIVYPAFSNSFKKLIKPVKYYKHRTYNDSSSELVADYVFLPSQPEIFGTNVGSYVATSPVEGTQWEYYANGGTTSRVKYANDNGYPTGSAKTWWTSSPSSFARTISGRTTYTWLNVSTSGATAYSTIGNTGCCLSPAFAL